MQNNTKVALAQSASKKYPGVIITRIFSREGIPACPDCYNQIQQFQLKALQQAHGQNS